MFLLALPFLFEFVTPPLQQVFDIVHTGLPALTRIQLKLLLDGVLFGGDAAHQLLISLELILHKLLIGEVLIVIVVIYLVVDEVGHIALLIV